MNFQEYKCQNGWKVKWSCASLSNNSDFMAMFRCGDCGPNMLFGLKDLKEFVLERKSTRVPHNVMVEALAALSGFLSQEIEQKIVA